MVGTFDDFLVKITGDGAIPTETEKLWLYIQNNRVPPTWLEASYATAHKSLAFYIADFIDRTNYWNQNIMNNLKVSVYQISTFYNPRQLLLAQL
jgi:hypothetical protein